MNSSGNRKIPVALRSAPEARGPSANRLTFTFFTPVESKSSTNVLWQTCCRESVLLSFSESSIFHAAQGGGV